jgi:cbb3-type cytochrome oxidase maturation protein
VSVIIVLLVASIAVASIFLVAFLLNVKKGQFNDEKSPPAGMLFGDAPPVAPASNSKPSTSQPNLNKHNKNFL